MEHLTDGSRFCPTLGFAFYAFDDGTMMLVETQRTIPRRFDEDPRPILTFAKPKKKK